MFEDCCVPCHQRRGRKAKDLPVGEVPGHNGQHDTERTKGNIAFSGVGVHWFVRQEVFCLFRKVIAVPGAFLDFRFGLSQGFAHFQYRRACQITFLLS